MVPAATSLGLQTRAYDPDESAPAGQVTACTIGAFDDLDVIAAWSEGLSVVTIESEVVPAATLSFLERRGLTAAPSASMLAVCQDRVAEKDRCARLGLPVGTYRVVPSVEDLRDAVDELGYPCILKARSGGYDGRSQVVIGDDVDIDGAWASLGERPCILEAFVPFDREVSIIGARAVDGTIATYPLVENDHRDGILRRTLAPAQASPMVSAAAEQIVRALLDDLQTVGLLTVELFQVGERLLVNELAPRVHNSGHWTIEGAVTSQFEQHLRAITGMELGSTEPIGSSVMWNLIGGLVDEAQVAAVPGAVLHRYGKEPRPARKVGHVTVTAATRAELSRRVEAGIASGLFPDEMLHGLDTVAR